ncbi:MAG: hypothetical protein ABEH40_02875 [Haloferacaceae archaeon]
MTDTSRRRLLALLGTGATAVLGGCSRLFTSPEPETPEVTPPATPDVTVPGTPGIPGRDGTATDSPTPTATPTPSLAAVGDVVVVRGTSLALTYLPVEDVVRADVRVVVENVGDRPIDLLELRVDLVYATDEERRAVAVDYVGFSGLATGGGGSAEYETRFPADGRANGSTDPDDFELVFRIRELEFGTRGTPRSVR